jgi:TonB family protein
LAGSLLAHALLLGVVLLLPEGGGAPQKIPIYTVKIVEAPQIPEARLLDLSPALRRELHLEAPTLTPDAPPLPTAPAPDVTGLDSAALPGALPPAPSLPRQAAPPGTPPAEPAPKGLVLPAPPALPQPPAARTARRAPPPGAPPLAAKAPAAPSSGAAAAPPPPDAPSLEERLRSKVQSMNLQVESAAPTPSTRPQAAVESEQSLLSLRLFQNTVRERVKQSYTFPGSFPEDLHARVRVVLERSGRLQAAELVESSGNERFDNLVCLAAIRNAKYPPLPASVEGATHTLFLTCSP